MALKILRYVLAWPRFLGWLFPLLAVATFFGRDLRLLDDAVLACTWRDWWAVTPRGKAGKPIWKYSTTLAAGMCLHPWSDERVEAHERVHVRQAEDAALAGLTLALVTLPLTWSWAALALWPIAMVLVLFPAPYLAGALRGGHIYRDAENERSAYAQTDRRPDGSSWLSEHLSKPRGW